MSPSSTAVHDGQHDTKYVTFEVLLHAAFVADDILGVMCLIDQLVYSIGYRVSDASAGAGV